VCRILLKIDLQCNISTVINYTLSVANYTT